MFAAPRNCRQLGFARASITTEMGEKYLPWFEYGIRLENISKLTQIAEINALVMTVNLVMKEIEFEPRGSHGEPFVHIYTISPYVPKPMNERRHLCEDNNRSDIHGRLDDQDLLEELMVCNKALETIAEVFYYSVPPDRNDTLRNQYRSEEINDAITPQKTISRSEFIVMSYSITLCILILTAILLCAYECFTNRH